MFQRGTFTVILFLKQQVAVSYISKKTLIESWCTDSFCRLMNWNQIWSSHQAYPIKPHPLVQALKARLQNSVRKKKISNTNKNHEALNLEIPHPGMKCLMFNIDFSHASSLVMIVCAQFWFTTPNWSR